MGVIKCTVIGRRGLILSWRSRKVKDVGMESVGDLVLVRVGLRTIGH